MIKKSIYRIFLYKIFSYVCGYPVNNTKDENLFYCISMNSVIMLFPLLTNEKNMKRILPLLLSIPVLLINLGCESDNNQPSKKFNDKLDTVSPDSGFVKFDPSKMDSNPQQRKKIVRVISGKESLRSKPGKNN